MKLTASASPRPRRSGTGEVLTQYREAIAGSIIAIAIEVANYFLFKHNPAGSLLALLIAILGVLLALQRSAVQLTIQETLQSVKKLAEIVDLQADSNEGYSRFPPKVQTNYG